MLPKNRLSILDINGGISISKKDQSIESVGVIRDFNVCKIKFESIFIFFWDKMY